VRLRASREPASSILHPQILHPPRSPARVILADGFTMLSCAFSSQPAKLRAKCMGLN
jgi:hypothetical protein